MSCPGPPSCSYSPKCLEKRNSQKSISTILNSPNPMRLEDGLLPRPSTAGHPQDIGVLDSYASRCKSHNTKRPELQFHVVLGQGDRDVRFERATR
jgi:hypothetical protein